MGSLWGRNNIMGLLIGCLVVGIGYICLAQGPADNPISLTLAPFLLIAGYCIIVPLSIVAKDKDKEEKKKK
ncbi:MAG: hypothetical protein N2053_06080 [Chitinispirillaceae bacterium]|nr:hypothetical protein [Chitinispirillaceae bacterium]